MGLLDFGRDTAQAASNSVAGTVSAPVDGIAWLLRKAGLNVGDAPFGGSEWMAQKGLTAPVQNQAAGLLGDTLGMVTPMAVSAKAPQIARGLLAAGENLNAPRLAYGPLADQAGVIRWYGGQAPQRMEALAEKYPQIDASIMDSPRGLTLSKVVIPKAERGSGLGSEFMSELTGTADDLGKTIALTPSADFGGSKARLIDFYKRSGFVPNKGKNIDYEISEAMYRRAQDAGK